MTSSLHPSNKLQKRRNLPVILKRCNHFNCIDLIVITTKNVYIAVKAGGAAASLGKLFWAKFERNLGKIWQIWKNLNKLGQK